MESSSRWIAIAAILGLCAAYALSGGGAPAKALPAVQPRTSTGAQPAPPAPVAKSALKVNPEKVDFGEVLVGQTVRKEAAVENPTTKPITVTNVRVNCGCVKAEMPQTGIEPGQSQPLKLQFIGIAGKRPATYTVTLRTDEPENAQAALLVSGKVKQVFIVDPPTLVFGTVPKNHPKTLTATIKQMDDKPFQIKTIAASHKEFSFKWEPLPEGGYRILATVQGLAIGRPMLEEVGIITDHPVVPAVPLRISARITGDVISQTPLLMSNPGPDGRPAPFEVNLQRLTPGQLVIEKVTEGEGAALDWQAQPLDQSTCHLTIRITEPVDRPLGGEFLVLTNAEKEPLRVPFRIGRTVPRSKPPAQAGQPAPLIPPKKPVQP